MEVLRVERPSREPSPLRKKVALFDTKAQQHLQKQSVNPFSHGRIISMPKPQFSKAEYGRPEKGSLSEFRALKASSAVWREMLTLCEVLHRNGEKLYTEKEKPNDPRKVIAFGRLFDIYTTISDKLVGMLLRTRKHKLVEFEGEVLFQRRDDHVPIILLKSIEDIRKILNEKISEAEAAMRESKDIQEAATRHSDSD